MNNDRFTKSVNSVMENAVRLAYRSGGEVGTEHILYGILAVKESQAADILRKYGVSLDMVSNYIRRRPPVSRVYFTPGAKSVLDNSVTIASELGSDYVGTEHLLLAILQAGSMGARILNAIGINVEQLAESIINFLEGNKGYSAPEEEDAAPPAAASPELDLMEYLENFFGIPRSSDPFRQGGAKEASFDRETVKASQGKPVRKESSVPQELEGFGVDLTERAKENKLDPVIGRTAEIERIIQTLSRRTKNNPVLIGEPGVGKSAVVEGLAIKIVQDEVPDLLKGKKVFSLDMGSILAGTKYRGDFEERFKNALDAIKKDGNIILFIDEIHTIVRAGATEGALDAANMLKPLLARGEIQTIGATTIDEYRKYIEKDAALERRFQPVMVEQPSVADTIEILKGLRSRYEEHHKVEITDDALSAAAILSDRYVSDRFLPDKAIDLIDEAASRKKLYSFTTPESVKELEKKIAQLSVDKSEAIRRDQLVKAQKLKEEIDVLEGTLKTERAEWEKKVGDVKLSIGEEEIAEIVSSWTGIPLKKINEDESEKLLHLEDILSSRVIGQKEAVSSIARAIKRARAGLKDPKRPIGSFIFLGPTGVGKTELSKALAEAMFGDEDMLIRVDMSEYMEKHNVSKMIGSAPGYVGYDEGGQLTEKVRRKPYSVILFDEIEKAHPDVFNILLQILDDGRLTDSHGRTVNFKNTIIIMTSNIGASEISRMSLGFAGGSAEEDYEKMKEKQMSALKKTMKPEFLNRIDDIIIFSRLSKEDIGEIADLMIKNLSKRLAERDITIEVAKDAKEYIIEKGYDKEYGARPMKRTIQKLIEDRLSEEILKGAVAIGDKVKISLEDDVLVFAPEKTENSAGATAAEVQAPAKAAIAADENEKPVKEDAGADAENKASTEDKVASDGNSEQPSSGEAPAETSKDDEKGE